MATSTSPLGRYYVKPAVGGGIAVEFRAASQSDALIVAQSLSTLFAETLECYAQGVAGEVASTFTPGSQGTTVLCPSGISRIPRA